MQLQDFFDYKNQLMKDLLTSEAVVHLLDEDLPVEDGIALAYTQVFPFEYLPETVQEGKTFICFDVDVQKSLSKPFLEPTIYIWVFSHKSKLRLPEGGVRTDKLCHEICKLINGSRMYGLGELDLYSVKRFAPQTDYQGKCMTFDAKEFSRVYDPNRPVPTNRKMG